MVKTYLVTGGAGFLGSHLCKRLLEDGHHVICMDNFLTGRSVNISELEKSSRFSLVEHNIIDPFPKKLKRRLNKIDGIFNLACPASPPHYQANPIQTIKVCTIGLFNLFELALELKIPVLHTSTSEVYGDPDKAHHPQTESYRGNVSCTGPRACYDEGKRIAETIGVEYLKKGLDLKTVRIFNTYGPNLNPHDGRVVSNFILQALQGKPITIYGDGHQTRSFCFVDDLIDGFIRYMQTPDINQAINLGNPDEFTIKQLAEKILELTGSASELSYKPLPKDDPLQRKPDIALAGSLLGWSPSTSLEEGLKKTIAHYQAIELPLLADTELLSSSKTMTRLYDTATSKDKDKADLKPSVATLEKEQDTALTPDDRGLRL